MDSYLLASLPVAWSRLCYMYIYACIIEFLTNKKAANLLPSGLRASYSSFPHVPGLYNRILGLNAGNSSLLAPLPYSLMQHWHFLCHTKLCFVYQSVHWSVSRYVPTLSGCSQFWKWAWPAKISACLLISTSLGSNPRNAPDKYYLRPAPAGHHIT